MSADERVEAVVTGSPEVRLLACTACGVLLWDIDSHYAHAHPDRTIRAPWDSETGCFGHCDPEGWAECKNRTNGAKEESNA